MELIAKIRAEIDRLKEENNNIKCKYNEKYCIGYDDAFNDLLSFLDTLQEPKNAEDYHKAFDELYGEHIPNLQEPENPIYELNQFLINWVRDGQTDAEKDARWEAYRRFFELHDEAMMQEPEVDLDANIEMEWNSFNKHIAKYGEETEDVIWLNRFSFEDIARNFYNLGKNARKEENK